MRATLALLELAQKYSDQPLRGQMKERGVIRLVTKEKQEMDYRKAAEAIPHLVELVDLKGLDYIKGGWAFDVSNAREELCCKVAKAHSVSRRDCHFRGDVLHRRRRQLKISGRIRIFPKLNPNRWQIG